MNYRGEPPQLPQPNPSIPPPPPLKEEQRSSHDQSGARSQELVHRLGLPPGLALLPGDGSWMFNSIESTAKKGLAPTHVPRRTPPDMLAASSERVVAAPTPRPGMTPTPRPGMRARQTQARNSVKRSFVPRQRLDKPTIPPQYKEVLSKSEDYKNWVKLKQEFLRDNKMLFERQGNLEDNSRHHAGKIPTVQGLGSDITGKFPHFPNNVIDNQDMPRPQREILDNKQRHEAPSVYDVDGVLYRSPTASTSRAPVLHHKSKRPSQKNPHAPRRPQRKKKPRPTVSSLSLPSHGIPKLRFPPTTLQSPTPSHAPPLPPGYELVPIDQLTEEHEVVPWEELPKLMEEHNLSLHHIPLGPYPSSTLAPPTLPPNYSPSPFTPRTPTPTPFSYSPTTPKHYSSSTPLYPHTYSTKAPFTAFSPTGSTVHRQRYTPTPTMRYSAPPQYPRQPYGLPPPFSPDIALGQSGLHSPPKHGVSGYKTITSYPTTPPPPPPPPPPQPKSIHFGTHFANVPKKTLQKTTPSTYRYNPTTIASILSYTPSIYSTTQPSTLGRYSPGPAYFATTLSPHFESTKVPVTPPPQPYHLVSSPHYSSVHPSVYSTTNRPLPTYQAPTTAPVKHHHTRTKSTPLPVYPPPMPSVLPPPNNPLPTYFDVATPVEPRPPPPNSKISPKVRAPSPIMHRPTPAILPETPAPIFQQQLLTNSPTTLPPPIRLRGTLRPKSPRPSHLTTAAVAVFRPQTAVPSHKPVSFPSFKQQPSPEAPRRKPAPTSSPHRPQAPFSAPKPDPRVVAITTARPELVTKENPKRHRSSTEREWERHHRPRLTPRPQSPNFHPIPPSPPGPKHLVTRLPQARPNVPESENQHRQEIGPSKPRPTDLLPVQTLSPGPTNDKVRVLTNDNNGIFFLEETLNAVTPFKRDFVPKSKQPPTPHTPSTRQAEKVTFPINPAITDRPRTWPSTLKKTPESVSVVETSKNGQLAQDDRVVESTTFSTSRVHVASSTTAAPRTLEQMLKMMEEKMQEENKATVNRLKIAKGQKLLAAIREKVAAREQMMTENSDKDVVVNNRGHSADSIDQELSPSDLAHVHSNKQMEDHDEEEDDKHKRAEGMDSRRMARLKSRRKKLSQRAKALAKALGDITEDEPYVVFPMDDINTKEKTMDEIFSSNPGLKRISAYDFEAAMTAKKEVVTEKARPFAELKLSIDDLTDTMSKLSNTVYETTTKKDTESMDKINQLQEEIAKLTQTLANLQVAPTTPQEAPVQASSPADFQPNR